MFIHTENDNESHRNTRNINVYAKTYTKHENTLSNFQNVQKEQNSITSKKNKLHKSQRFMLICMALLFYPSEGCFSDVRGPFRTKDPKIIPNK